MEYLPKNNENLDYLYKFRSLEESNFDFTKNILINNELYFSSPTKFEDPFDCRPRYTIEGAADSQIKEFL